MVEFIGKALNSVLRQIINNFSSSSDKDNASEINKQTSTTAPTTTEFIDNNYNFQFYNNRNYNQNYNYSQFDNNCYYSQNLNNYRKPHNKNIINNNYQNNNNQINGDNRFFQSAYGVKTYDYLNKNPYQYQSYYNKRSPEKKNNKIKVLNLNQDVLINAKKKRHLSPINHFYGNINKIQYFPKNEANEIKKIIKVKSLGKGGFGEVNEIIYKGYKYAGKYIYKEKFKNDYIEKALQNEISILTKMNSCNNSVKYYKHLEDEEKHILILELCDCDLQYYIDQNINGLDENMIYSIMKQLNNTFMIFYKDNIIHRDIKPKNILIKYVDNYHKNIIPKMSDYGISKICIEASTLIGTRNYIAPEIFLGNPKYNSKVDLWSIGIMIYYMHFREYPFGNLDEVKNFFLIPKLVNRKKNRCCKDYFLDDLINKLLAYYPENRLSWKEYFEHQFFKKYYYN